jgi:endonuclease III
LSRPGRIAAIHRILKREYLRHEAPVIDLIKVKTEDPFKVLVATILSARTRDETTSAASSRLFREARRPADLRRLGRARIAKLIFPVGFFRTKAGHLRRLPDALDRLFGGRIPEDIDGLCRLPGVGRKTANLVRSVAFGLPAICVDVHVHRISNRLGLVRTRTPFETEMALRRSLPPRYWKTWNSLLVSHGQTVCFPRRPACGGCGVRGLCRRVGVDAEAGGTP